jgi:hypothetical protein
MDYEEFYRQMAYHAATPEGRDALKAVREKIGDIGMMLCEVIPPSAERTIALRSLLDARMKCNAALMLSGPEMGVPS